MTTIFVYESCCALGLGRDPGAPAHSLYREGRAMRDAVAADFRLLPDVETVATLDDCLADEESLRFEELAASCDWTLVIAPELGGELGHRCETVLRVGGHLLGPAPAAVAATSSKTALARLWERSAVPTPRTRTWSEFLKTPRYPAVCKPDDGAGSTATCRVDGPANLDRARAVAREAGYTEGMMLLQDFVPGLAASLAFLTGPGEPMPLVPARQRISTDGRFRYEGGELPLPRDLAHRAVRLGRSAIGPLTGLCGYLGVDLILGSAPDGSADVALEINPRLTTSYVGLRALADFNMAAAMLGIARGDPVTELAWKPGTVRFWPDGTIRLAPLSGDPAV